MPIKLGRSKYDYQPDDLFRQYKGLSWVANNRYDRQEWEQAVRMDRPGTVLGGPTFQSAYDMTFSPEKYTAISPISRLTSPILSRGTSHYVRTGQFSLDLINWPHNIEQLTGQTIGSQDAAVGPMQWTEAGPQPTAIDPFLDFLSKREIGFENAPQRLMDYAFSPLEAAGILNSKALDQPLENPVKYPFQESPYYWDWLSNSTPEQRKQQAKFIADSRADAGRNQPLFEMLAKQFDDDYGSLGFRSSGNERIDYLAKQRLQTNPAGLAVELALRNGDYSLVDLYPEAAASLARLEGYSGYAKFREYQREQGATYDGGTNFIGGVAAELLPFIGTQVGEAIAPISDDTEAMWETLSPEQRKYLLDGYGLATTAADMTYMFTGFAQAGKALTFLTDAKKVESLLAATKYPQLAAALRGAPSAGQVGLLSQWGAQGVGRSLQAVNTLMGVGLVNMMGAWAVESAAPMDSEWAQFAERMDASRLVSSSVLGGILNEAGFWAGFYGVDALAGAGFKVGRKVIGTGIGEGKRLFGGLADAEFHSMFGGSSLGTVFEKHGITRQVQGAAETTLWQSAMLNLRREDLARAKLAIDNGQPTGTFLDGLPVDQRAAAWEAEMAVVQRYQNESVLADVALYNAARTGALRKSVSREAQAMKPDDIARSMDHDVARYVEARYGALRWPAAADGLKAEVARRIAGISGADAGLMASISSWAGKSPDRWGQALRKVHQLLYHQRHVEMVTIAEAAGEDAGRFGVFSDRTLWRDDVPKMVESLTDAAGGTRAMHDLIAAKDDVERWFSDGQFHTPEELAAMLTNLEDAFPALRQMDGSGSTFDQFQEALDAEGIWRIGYKTVGSFRRIQPNVMVRIEQVTPETLGKVRVARTPESLLAEGYRQPYPDESMLGRELLQRDPVFPIEEYGGGVWFKERPGDDPIAYTHFGNVQAASTGTIRPADRRLERLADPYYWSTRSPYVSDLVMAPKPGTEHKVFDADSYSAYFTANGVRGERFRPGAGGRLDETAVPWGTKNLDEAPDPIEEVMRRWDTGHTFEPSDEGIEKAGVIVFERMTDGSYGVWAMHPKDSASGQPFAGYEDLTFPKGGRERGETPDPSLRATAARELYEELGMEAAFYGHAGDFADPGGAMTRYYVGIREAGGPDFALTPHELGHAELVPIETLPDRLIRNGVRDARDTEALQAAVERMGLTKEVGDDWYLGGRNAGANWPVLKDVYFDELYVFKAEKGYPITSLNDAVQLAAPNAAKAFEFAGLNVAAERPFEYRINGDLVSGTIQPLLRGDPVEVLKAAPRPLELLMDTHQKSVVEALQQQHVVDWFTSQHDSNADSMLEVGGELVGVDKGQAWKFFGDDSNFWHGGTNHEDAAFHDPEGFWLYGQDNSRWVHPTAGDKHLGAYLWAESQYLDRNAVEEVVQRIESIPDAQLEGWLSEQAAARERQGWGTAADFIDAMKRRRDDLRASVNAAYERIGQLGIARPGETNFWRAGLEGTVTADGPIRINSDPKLPLSNPDFSPPPIPGEVESGNALMNVGVLVEEGDGRVWSLLDTLNGERRLPTKRAVTTYGESVTDEFLASAVHEAAAEELGLSVRIERVIGDVRVETDTDTVITRYYLVTRTGGGPKWANTRAKDRIAFGTREGALVNPDDETRQAFDLLAGDRRPAGPEAEPAPVESMDPGVAPDPVGGGEPTEYVSYATLPNGEVYRSPWIEYPFMNQADVALGNRAILSQKLDAAFRGWRSSRILDMQKATLYRRLDSLSPAFTPTRITRFHEGLVELARKHRFPGIQPLGTAYHWLEVPGVGSVKEEVEALAAEVFGKGPFPKRGQPGEFVPDWGREIAKAYRTSLKMNMTAGITSHLKAMGYVGAQASFIADLVYPTLRFAISPLFKAGEWWEGAQLNSMRGANPFGMDDVARAAWERTGLPTSGAEYAETALTDPMLAAMGRSEVRNRALRASYETMPTPEGYAAEVARRRSAGSEAPMTAADQTATHMPDPLRDSMLPPDFGARRTFDDVPTHDVEWAIPHHADPDTGEIVFDREAIQRIDAERVTEFRRDQMARMFQDVLSAERGDEAIQSYTHAAGWIKSNFTDDEIRRLAENVPIIHATGSGKYDANGMHTSQGANDNAGLRDIEQWLADGTLPLTGPAGRSQTGLREVPNQAGQPAIKTSSERPSTSTDEQLAGMVDAPYAGAGRWEEGIGFILRNDRVIPRSVITDGDRISLMGRGPQELVEKHIIFPNGAADLAEQAVRYSMLRAAKQGIDGAPRPILSSFREGGGTWGSMSPMEYTIPGGGTWDDICGILIDTAEGRAKWAELVAQYGDMYPALREIEVIDSGMEGAWKFMFERAGLADRAGLEPRVEDVWADQIPQILPEEFITVDTVAQVSYGLDNRAAIATRGEKQIMHSLEDVIRAQIARHRSTIKTLGSGTKTRIFKESDSYVSRESNATDYQQQLAYEATRAEEYEGRARVLENLLAEVEDWRRSLPMDAETAIRINSGLIPESDPARLALAAEIDQQLMALRMRAEQAGAGTSQNEFAFGAESTFHWRHRGTREKVDNGPEGTLPPAAGEEFGHYATTPEQDVELYRTVNRWLDAQRVQVSDREPNFQTLFDPPIARAVAQQIAPTNFADELKRLASVKTGREEMTPQVKVWLRGEMPSMSDAHSASEIIITVSYPDGTFPLTLAEIQEAWLAKGLPDSMKAAGQGGGPPDMTAWWMDGGNAASSAWTPDGGPAGSILLGARNDWSVPPGTWGLSADGTRWEFHPDPAGDVAARPLTFLYSYEKGSYEAGWSLSDDLRVFSPAAKDTPSLGGVPGHMQYGTYSGMTPNADGYRYMLDQQGNLRWAWGQSNLGGYSEVQISALSASIKAREEAIRDAIDNVEGPIRLIVRSKETQKAAQRVALLNELPDRVEVELRGQTFDPHAPGTVEYRGQDYARIMTDDELRAIGLPRQRTTKEAPPDSLEEVHGSAEAVTAEIEEVLRRQATEAGTRGKVAEGFKAFMNPIPYKQRQQDRLIREMVRDVFPDVLERQQPHVYDLIHNQIGVPRREMVDYMLEDRALLNEWIRTGDEADFIRLVEHADKYGIAKGDARAAMDSLHESKDWSIIQQLMHWTAKGAVDESFGVHFFNQYRSTFERSINHPLLGIYPASWSYKVAKEWFRFLYKNQTFGVNIGMTPARAIYQIAQAQHEAFARDEGGDLNEWLDYGPLSSSMFIFNLILPGDWSNLPFPLSRSLRDMLRGNFSPTDHLTNNLMKMGVGRDIRLATEVANEWWTLATGNTGKGRRPNEYEVAPATP